MSGDQGYDDAMHQELRDAGRLVAPPPAHDLDEALCEQIRLGQDYADELSQAREILERVKREPPMDAAPDKLEQWRAYMGRCEKIVAALEQRNAKIIDLDAERRARREVDE